MKSVIFNNIGLRVLAISEMKDSIKVSSKTQSVNINKLYRTYNANNRDNLFVPEYKSVRGILHRANTVDSKPNPKIYSQIPNEDPLYYTIDDDIFMRFKTHEYIIFSSTNQLQLIRTCSDIFIDGTFFICPIVYKQVLLIIGYNREFNDYFCCSYILMSDKNTNTYSACLSKLKEIVENTEKDYNANADEEDSFEYWTPERVHCDMEIGIINSIKMVFGNEIDVKLCYFHYADALRKNIASKGFKRLLKNSSSVRRSYLQLKYLAFVPPQHVEDIFTIIVDNCENEE